MKSLAPLLAAALCAGQPVLAQADLTAQLDQLIALAPTEVRAGKDTYSQELSYDAAAPYRLRVTQTEEDSRGDVVGAEVNLGLVKRARMASGRGDALRVMLLSPNTPSVRLTDDGEPDGYEEEFGILASDVDNARAMEPLIAQLLPLAEGAYAEATAIPDDLPALQEFLAGAVGETYDGDDVYEQTLAFAETPGEATATVGGSAVRDELQRYAFRLGDLEPRQVEVDERGHAIEVTAATRRGADLVAHTDEDGEREFEDELTLYFPDYESALQAAEALRRAIPLARAADEAALPSYASPGEAVEALSGLLAAANSLSGAKTAELSQARSGDCDAVLAVEETGRTTERNEYGFTFADLNARAADVGAREGLILFELETAGRADLVSVTEDGELDGYDDAVTFRFATPRDFDRGERAIEYLAEACAAEVPTPTVAEVVALLSNDRIGADGEIEQAASVDAEGCAFELKVIESGRGSADETESSFNLRDLNTRSGELEVRGTTVRVVFAADRGQDLIQVLEDGEDLGYEDEVTFYAPDLAAAKAIMKGIAAGAEACGARR